MAKKLFLSAFFFLLTEAILAQNIWFKLHQDSVELKQQAETIKDLFVQDINAIKPELNFSLRTTIKTTPMLIFYNEQTAHIPLWSELPEPMQNWFYEQGESISNGRKIFALFFNGFYLPHELAHGFEDLLGKLKHSYQNEFFANTVAILWLRKHNYHEELKNCYEAAKKIMAKTPNPVPEGELAEDFFTKNYSEILHNGNPSVYGYMQFGQFIKIYEDERLPDFDTYIKARLNE